MIMSDEYFACIYKYIPSHIYFIIIIITIIIIIIIIISVLARCYSGSLFVEQRDGPWRFVKNNNRLIYKWVFQWINGESL